MTTKRKTIAGFFALCCVIITLTSAARVFAQDCNKFALTSQTYSEKDNLASAVTKDLGRDFSIADWTDLKSVNNINAWISCMGLQKGQTFMITKNGKLIQSGKRQYFVLYSPGGAPAGFLVHEKIDNKLFLGSWTGEKRSILAINKSGNNNDQKLGKGVSTRSRNDDGNRDRDKDWNAGNYDPNYFEEFDLTHRAYPESVNMINIIKNEFGHEFSVADWSDIKSVRNIDTWISSLRLRKGQTFFVTKNGDFRHRDDNQYFVLYAPGGPPQGFNIRDEINNTLFLGTWHGEIRKILVKYGR